MRPFPGRPVQQGHPLSFVAFRQIPWYSFNRLQAEQSVLNMRSPFMDNFLLEVVYQAPEQSTRSKEISLRLISDGDRKLGGDHDGPGRHLSQEAHYGC